jgi:MUG2-like C-terminal domain
MIEALSNQQANSYIQFYALAGHGLGNPAENLRRKKRAIGLAIGLHQLIVNQIE